MKQNQNIQQPDNNFIPAQCKDAPHVAESKPQPISPTAEFLIDLTTASIFGWVVYRASESANWAVTVGFLILVASYCKQGIKHFYNQLIRPSYLKSSPLVKALWKTIPVCGLSMIGLIRLFGASSGLFATSVVLVIVTLILWLHESNLSA